MDATPATPPDPTLDHALAYAELGWRVLPIRPGAKTPSLTAWTDAATTDAATIRGWWTGLYRGHGIGIALDALADSGQWVFAVDIDGESHGVDGAATWHELCAAYPDDPPATTIEATTGGGGTHLLYTSPTPIRNGKLGDGIDIRGVGGQILVEPSTHPNGQPYTWLDGQTPFDLDPAPAPPWVLAMLAPPAPATTSSTQIGSSAPTGDRPGDLWAATVTWPQLLTADGWQLHHTDRTGEHHWTRPGKPTRDGTSATTGFADTDTLKIFTSSMSHAGLDADGTYTKLGYLAATRHGGDHAAAARALHAAGHHTPTVDVNAWLNTLPGTTPTAATPGGSDPFDDTTAPDLHGWETTDLADVLADGYTPPTTTLGPLDGGGHLFYPARVNALYGVSGAGKSWVAIWACAIELEQDRHAIYIDLEDHAGSVAARFTALGVDRHTLGTHLHYIAPGTAWNPAAFTYLADIIAEHEPTVVVIDSTGEAMALDGAAPNDDDDTARWFRRLPRRLADLGPAVILTDHVPKAKDRPKGFAMGSQRKRAALDGIAFDVDARVSPAKGTTGHLGLTVAKDRNGTYPNGTKVADVHIASDDDGTRVEITVTDPTGNHRPTVLMERVSRYLEENGAASKRDIERNVKGEGASLRTATDLLRLEDYAAEEPRPGQGGGSWTRSVRPFRHATAWLPDDETGNEPNADTAVNL